MFWYSGILVSTYCLLTLYPPVLVSLFCTEYRDNAMVSVIVPYLMKFSMVRYKGAVLYGITWYSMAQGVWNGMIWHYCRALWQCDRGEAGCPPCHLSIGHLVGTPQCIGHPTMCPTSLFLISSSQSRSQTLQLPMQISIPKSIIGHTSCKAVT